MPFPRPRRFIRGQREHIYYGLRCTSRLRIRAWGTRRGCLGVSGCGGSGSRVSPGDPFAYNAARPLAVSTGGSGQPRRCDRTDAHLCHRRRHAGAGPVHGPASPRPRGCLIYQPGVGTPKEAAAAFGREPARLGLAVFTIDPRYTGARAGGPIGLTQVFASPDSLVSFLRDDVIDLRRGLDYLERQAACHHNVGYLGISQGAILGVLLSGADNASAQRSLSSTGATWRARLFYSPYVLRRATERTPDVRDRLGGVAALRPGEVDRQDRASAGDDRRRADRSHHPPGRCARPRRGRRPAEGVAASPRRACPVLRPAGPGVQAQIAAFLNKHLLHH